MAKAAEAYALGPTRVQHQNRDPRRLQDHQPDGRQPTMIKSLNDVFMPSAATDKAVTSENGTCEAWALIEHYVR